MKTMLLTLLVPLVALVAGNARADVLSERVVLEMTQTPCPGSLGRYEVRAVPLAADGKPVLNTYPPYVVPWGYALEINDIQFASGWVGHLFPGYLFFLAQNRTTLQTSVLYGHKLGPAAFRNMVPNTLTPSSSVSAVVAEQGATQLNLVQGLLLTYEARLCVQPPFDANLLDGSMRITLRGRLHKLDNVPAPPQPPLPDLIEEKR